MKNDSNNDNFNELKSYAVNIIEYKTVGDFHRVNFSKLKKHWCSRFYHMLDKYVQFIQYS